MNSSPKYRLYKKPRFSANAFATYLSEKSATSRRSQIQNAKFLRIGGAIPYSEARKEIINFLDRGERDFSYLETVQAKFRSFGDGEANPDKKVRYMQNAKAIEAFTKLMQAKKFPGITFSRETSRPQFDINGLTINVPIAVQLEKQNGKFGGSVCIFVSSDGSRMSLKARINHLTNLVYWCLSETNSQPNLELDPGLCRVFDVFGHDVAKASGKLSALVKLAGNSAKEIVELWDSIEPPSDYDGPEWMQP